MSLSYYCYNIFATLLDILQGITGYCRPLGRAGKEAWKAHNEKGAKAYEWLNWKLTGVIWVAP